jgi:hypothetical protein
LNFRIGGSEFKTNRLIPEFELFAISLHNALKSAGNVDALVRAITDVCGRWNVPLIDVDTDCDAVFTTYAALKLMRFTQSPKHVLFADVFD